MDPKGTGPISGMVCFNAARFVAQSQAADAYQNMSDLLNMTDSSSNENSCPAQKTKKTVLNEAIKIGFAAYVNWSYTTIGGMICVSVAANPLTP